MSAHGVVGDSERLPEILDRAAPSPELGNDLTSCRVEKPCVEMHRERGGYLYNVANNTYVFNKSSDNLTNIQMPV